MPLPNDIDAVRAMMHCLGITLPGNSPRDQKLALDRVGAFLEIPSVQLANFGLRAEEILSRLSRQREDGPAQWLQLPYLATRALEEFLPLAVQFFSSISLESLERFLTAQKLPESTLKLLMPALAYQATKQHRGFNELRIGADTFCAELLDRFPSGYRYAAKENAPLVPPDTAATTLSEALTPLAHIGYRLTCAQDFWRSRKFAKSVRTVLRAWSEAFNNHIASACRFVTKIAWFETHRTSTLPPTPYLRAAVDLPPQEAFIAARDWCQRQDIEFPFYEHLHELQHDQRNIRFRIHKSSVELITRSGVHLPTMLVESLLDRVMHDVHIGLFFDDAIPFAVMARADRNGAFDQAWNDAIRRIPDLAHVASVSHTPRASRPRVLAPRKHHRASTQPSPVYNSRSATATKAIYELLLDLFSVPELRIFIAHYYDRPVINSLPEGSCTPAEFVHAAIETLRRHVSHFEHTLFSALYEARPSQTSRIEAVAVKLGIHKHSHQP